MTRRLTAFAGIGAALALAACGQEPADAPMPDLPEPGEPDVGATDSGPTAADLADADFPHEVSDIPADPAVRYGVLDNGFRYAILENDTPSGMASLRLRFDVGSMMETEEQRGLAHFLEHMAFNGSENVPENEMIRILERHGLAFGADTNAYTSFGETVYMLELPETDEETMDVSFMLMDELNALLLDDGAIDRERGVVLSEMRTRNSPDYRASVAQYGFLFEGTRLADRLPIGTAEVLEEADSELFRDLYEKYYTPGRAFFAAVGDFDADEIEARIRETFGDWEAPAEPAPEPDLGAVDGDREPAAFFFQDPAIPTMVDINFITPAENPVDSEAQRREDLLAGLGMAILNRRYSTLSRNPDAVFLQASAGASEYEDLADVAYVTIYSEPENWDEAMGVVENEMRRAIEYGFTEAELAEQLASARQAQEVAASQADTRQSSGLSSSIVGAFNIDRVFSHPRDSLERFNRYVDGLTVDEVNAAFREQWQGAQPLIFVTSPEDIENPRETILAEYEAARAQPVTAPEETGAAEFAYTDFGEPGEVVEHNTVEDLGLTRIRFDNNVMLNFKQTDFEDDAVRVSLRFGGGVLEVPADSPELRFVASNVLAMGGLGEHSLDELQTLLAGRTVSLGFGSGTDAFSAGARTTPADLEMQLQLWAAYLTDAAYRPEALSQFRQQYAIVYPTMSATPGAVLGRELQRILYNGDGRFAYPEPEAVDALSADQARSLMQRALSEAAIEVAIVGDITEDEAVAAVAGTLGALPERAAEPLAFADARNVTFPEPETITLRHDGEADQAAALIYWPTPDGRDVVQARKLSMLAGVLRIRMIEKVREELGATYSPGVATAFSRDFPGYGYIGAQMEVDTADMDEAFEVADEIAADFAAGNITQDEFDRALRPLLEGIEENQEQNPYWVSVIGQAQTQPEDLDRHRSQRADYEAVTLDDVKALAAEYLTPEGALRIQVLPLEDGEGDAG